MLNHQRQSIYARRRKILYGADEEINELLNDIILGDESLISVVEEKRKALGDEEYINIIRRVLLQTSDMLWVEHLELMDYVRSSVNLRAYGQRDPLIEYKKRRPTSIQRVRGSL